MKTQKALKIKFPDLTSPRGLWNRVLLSAAAEDDHTHNPTCMHPEGEHNNNCCRRHAVVLPGYGKKEYPLPSPDELVASSIAYIQNLAKTYDKRGKRPVVVTEGEDKEAAEQKEQLAFITAHGVPQAFITQRIFANRRWYANAVSIYNKVMRGSANGGPDKDDVLSGIGSLPDKPIVHGLIPSVDGRTTPTTGPVLRVAAGTLAEIMHAGRFKAVIARQFDPLKGAVNWALGKSASGDFNMPAKYHPAASSLREHLNKLEGIYSESLPRVIQFLSAQYPKASEEELLQAAVSVLNEQLAEILYVLSIWTDAFAQQRDGMYKQLLYVIFTVEQAFYLFRTGDVKGECDEECQKRIKTHAFHIGDVFMARFGDQGPATIPGGKGPVGAHAIEVPHDESDVIVIYLPLYLHEFRHDYYNDVEGLPENLTQVTVEALKKAHKSGALKFQSETTALGKQQVPTLMLVTQIYAQTLSETDADISGGVLLSGPAFLYSMLATFCAFNMRGINPMNANRMLRHFSYFAVGPGGELAFEPHMPDYMRAYVVAAALDLIGFKAEADECRVLADNGAGVPKPTHIVWKNVDPKSGFKFQIKVSVEDLKAAAPFVVDALINAPLEALGGVATRQLVNWTPKRQAKVEALARNLMAGKSDIPWEMGDFWAPYVAAAAITAAWALWRDGLQPMLATVMVETNARKMLDQVKARHEQRLAEEARKASTPPVTEPSKDAAAGTVIVPKDGTDYKDGGADTVTATPDGDGK